MIKNSFDSGKGKIHLRFSSVCVEVYFDFMEKPITDKKIHGRKCCRNYFVRGELTAKVYA